MHTRRSHHNPNKKASSSGGTLLPFFVCRNFESIWLHSWGEVTVRCMNNSFQEIEKLKQADHMLYYTYVTWWGFEVRLLPTENLCLYTEGIFWQKWLKTRSSIISMGVTTPCRIPSRDSSCCYDKWIQQIQHQRFSHCTCFFASFALSPTADDIEKFSWR